jgi:uncharacterized protein YegP (UPF0339 family)
MRRIIAVTVLSVSLAVVGSSVLTTSADAQDKSKAKKEASAGTVEIYKAKDGGYRYRIKTADGKTLAIPTRSHDNKDDVAKDLEEIKTILNKVKPTDVKE